MGHKFHMCQITSFKILHMNDYLLMLWLSLSQHRTNKFNFSLVSRSKQVACMLKKKCQKSLWAPIKGGFWRFIVPVSCSQTHTFSLNEGQTSFSLESSTLTHEKTRLSMFIYLHYSCFSVHLKDFLGWKFLHLSWVHFHATQQ